MIRRCLVALGLALALIGSPVWANLPFTMAPLLQQQATSTTPVTFCSGSTSSIAITSATTKSNTATATGCSQLLAFIYFNGSGAPSAASCTYAGASMTQLSGSPFGSGTFIMAFYIDNPATGSNTISCSWTNTAVRGVLETMGVSGGSGTVTGITSASTGSTLTVTSTTSSLVISAIATGSTPTLSGGTVAVSANDGNASEILSVGYLTGAASTSVSWSVSTTGLGALVGFSSN